LARPSSTNVQEVAYILSQATPRSLVLVDELGRATSTADGVGLAWAVGEQLLSAGAPTLFATHFGQLAELAALYPAAKAWHFDVDASRNRLDFSWRLRPGANEAGHYGLLLAAAVGFPPDVLQAAEEVVQGGLGRCGWWGSLQASGQPAVACRTGWLLAMLGE
jgi:DNA mismatch repair protein MSH4